MDARAVAAASTRPEAEVPYRASWVDAVLASLEGLPGPTWLAFGVLALASVLIAEALVLLAGRDLSVTGPRFVLLALIAPYSLALLRHLNKVAGQATDQFRPLLGLEPAAFEALRYRVTVFPSSIAIPAAISIAIATTLGALNAPAAFEITGVPWPLAIGILVYAIVTGMAYSALGLQILRQLVFVDRIHRAAKDIDLFDPAPLHAFSRLTARAALGLLLLAAMLAAATGREVAEASAQFAASVAVFYTGFALSGVAAFIVPLYGMHQRIAAEKERLRTAADARLRTMLEAFHADASGVEIIRADGLNKLIATAIQERDLLAKLPTWPWQAATLRGFASALLLPVVVYILARAAERVVL
ncbi:MAG: hypothetical protein ACAH65_01460 [Chloroflexota bacterium]